MDQIMPHNQNETIAVNIVRYNQPLELLVECITAVLAQEYKHFTLTLTENGSRDSIEHSIIERFGHDSRFHFVDNHQNLGFAGAHNKFFANSDADLVMPLNPDAIMQSGFLEALVTAFDDEHVAAAEGKMLKPQEHDAHAHVLDGTGIIVSRTRRARERGQLEADHGQYDHSPDVFGVSGTAPLYRRSALETVRYKDEYFDEDFFMYWEDFDLSWRLRLAGFSCRYVPSAHILHERVGGQTRYGYRRPLAFAKHHAKFPIHIRRYNWRNHLFAIIKNDFGSSLLRDFPLIIGRELSMLGYIVLFEPSTLGAIPSFFHLLPKMLEKRKAIQAARKADSSHMGAWFLQSHSPIGVAIDKSLRVSVSPSAEHIDLSVIVVAFRGYQKLKDTIDALLASVTSYRYEIIVVDNGSGDGTPDSFERDFPHDVFHNITLIRSQNDGFSAGNNIGFAQSSGRTVLILNPDTAVLPDTIQSCMDYLLANPHIGALTAKLIKGDGTLDPACRRSFPTPLNALSRFLLLPKLFPNSKLISSYNLNYLPEDQIADVDCIVGAFMLIPRTVYESVGGFDEDYFMYGEDIDLCWKIHHAGYRIVYYPKATCWHFKGQSSRKTPFVSLYNFHESMWLFHKKRLAKSYPFFVNWAVWTGIWLRFAILYGRNLMRKNPYVSK